MIKFELSDNREAVKITVDPSVENTVFESYISCGDKVYSSLLQRRLYRQFSGLIEAIRKEEYELGYKHGRGKVGKKSWFSVLFETGRA